MLKDSLIFSFAKFLEFKIYFETYDILVIKETRTQCVLDHSVHKNSVCTVLLTQRQPGCFPVCWTDTHIIICTLHIQGTETHHKICQTKIKYAAQILSLTKHCISYNCSLEPLAFRMLPCSAILSLSTPHSHLPHTHTCTHTHTGWTRLTCWMYSFPRGLFVSPLLVETSTCMDFKTEI